MGKVFELVEDKNWMKSNDAVRTQLFQNSLLRIIGKDTKNSTVDAKNYASEIPH
jgi:hypothetical protein